MEYTRLLHYEFPLIRGEDVRAVQQALIALRVNPPCGTADGVFGDGTASTVKAFQHTFNVAGRTGAPPIPENGDVGADTWGALFGRARDVNASSSRIQAAASALAAPLPGGAIAPAPCLNADQVKRVRDWLTAHFASDIAAATAGTPVDPNLIYAIACQETAVVWLGWLDKLTPEQVLARCVFDASGDAPQTARQAFPMDTNAFRARLGDGLTQQLIAEANETRSLRGFSPKTWVYKGYGIFQYDLQNILADPDFFTKRLWADFPSCLDRLMRTLKDKLSQAQGNVQDAVRRYNGGGPAADRYAACVMQMREWCA